MNKLRINKDLYVIEVNDKGETIEFGPDDIELVFKLDRAYKAVLKVQDNLKADLLIISKRQDVTKKGEMMSENDKDTIKAYKKAFMEMRAAYDGFLGEGACQKIFGDRNYLEMFNDLNNELQPHFEKMKLNREKVVNKIKEKYANIDEDVLK